MFIHHSSTWRRWSYDHLLADEEYAGGIQEKMTAEEYYKQGNNYRQQGNFQEAINCYLEAIALDPNSPAVEAKRMLDDIFNYYCKDMYNP
jgi:tetratricopeptide (TPR) repeat protein